MSWASAIAALSPLGWWRFGGTSPALDSSGNGRTGSTTGGITAGVSGLLVGDSNTCYDFTTNGYVSVPDGAWMDTTTGFTILGLIRPDQVTTVAAIMSRRNSGDATNECWGLQTTAASKLGFIMWDSTGSLGPGTMSGATTLVAGSTYMYAVTFDGANVKIYVGLLGTGGALVLDATVARAVTMRAVTQVLQIGCRRSGGTNTNDPFDGKIDEPAMFGTALSAATLGTLFEEASGPPGPPTSVSSPAQTGTTLQLSWSPPTTLGPVVSYEARINAGTPVAATSPHTFTGLTAGTSYTMEVRAVNTVGTSSWVSVVQSTLAIPNVPAAVSCTDVTANTLQLTWSPPSGGGTVTHYEVRLDAGSPVTATSPYTFTGLTPETSYSLGVRAVGPGGESAWVTVVEFTGTPVDYHADIRVGAHTWSIDAGCVSDPDVVNVLAGASYTWTAPDDVGWPPPLHVVDRDVLTLRLFAPVAEDVADVRRGDLVRFKFTPLGHPSPLVDFAGRVRAVKITDRASTGAYLQLTAVDHTVTLQDWSIPGFTPVSADADTRAEILERIAEILSDMETAEDRDMVPGTFGDPLDTGDDSHYIGSGFGDYDIPADSFVSAFYLFARYGYGMMPVPQYDDTTGELDSAQPFVIAYLDQYGMDYLTADLDACLVPTESVDWQRDYTPNVVEAEDGTYWQGSTYAAPLPEYPDWNLLRLNETLGLNQAGFNVAGLTNEVPETDPWGPYTFTILGWQDPAGVVAPWLTIPDRWRLYVTITGIDPDKNPSGGTTVSGMLRSGTFTMGTDGRWTIDAGLRRSHPDT